MTAPIPADVYRAARRVYIGSTTDRAADDAIVRRWASGRWAGSPLPADAYKLAFWVMSQAAQDGHE